MSEIGCFKGGLNMIQADYDNDGDTDIFVLRGSWMRKYGRQPNSLLRNINASKSLRVKITFQNKHQKIVFPLWVSNPQNVYKNNITNLRT